MEDLCIRRDWQIQIKGELKCKFSLFASLFLSGPGYEDGHVSSQSLLIKADRFLRMISSSDSPLSLNDNTYPLIIPETLRRITEKYSVTGSWKL